MPRVLRNMGFPPMNDKLDNRVVIPDDTEFVPFSADSLSVNTEAEIIVEAPQEIARREAEEITKNAQDVANQIVSEATLQAEQIKKSAQQSGYDEAFQSQISDISATLTNAVSVLDEIKRAQDLFIEEYEKEIGRFAIDIARAILRHQIEVDPLSLCDMTEAAIAEIKEAKWAVLSLSKELVPLVELLQSELPEKCQSIKSLDILGRDIPKGSCMIETPNGILDASVDEQLRNLAQRFEQIKQKRGTT